MGQEVGKCLFLLLTLLIPLFLPLITILLSVAAAGGEAFSAVTIGLNVVGRRKRQ